MARYDFVPYRGGAIAIGGEEKDWELVFFLGEPATDAEALAWALVPDNRETFP